MGTSKEKNQPRTTQNAKILVNFKGGSIIHTYFHQGSDHFKALLDKGYVYVGEAKGKVDFYWEAEYFNPEDKYLRNLSNEDEITT